ncbi:MAG: ThiF family adenylyltransferase [Bryobacteraceae bacterium]
MASFDRAHIFSRLKGIFETDILRERLATIIGLGTGGSLAAVELAKCSVGRFRLIDFDVIESHNVVRHICGLRDLGRPKTEAVRDAILNFNPYAVVDCHNVDILDPTVDLSQLLDGSDIVLPCTDTERSKYSINRCLMRLWLERQVSIPAVYAGAYERAFGGDVIRVVPGETPCYDCVIGSVQQLPFMATMPRSTVAYSSLQSADDFRAEPGLGMDVHFLALIQTKLALMTLLRGTASILGDIPYNFLFWGNRKEWIFPEPFKAIFAKTERRADCATCGGNAHQQDTISREEILRNSAEILSAAKRAPEDDCTHEVAEIELPPDLQKYTS